jgi:hypothetical protein
MVEGCYRSNVIAGPCLARSDHLLVLLVDHLQLTTSDDKMHGYIFKNYLAKYTNGY